MILVVVQLNANPVYKILNKSTVFRHMYRIFSICTEWMYRSKHTGNPDNYVGRDSFAKKEKKINTFNRR